MDPTAHFGSVVMSRTKGGNPDLEHLFPQSVHLLVPCNYLRERKIRARVTLWLAPPLHGPLLILQQLSPDGHVCKASYFFLNVLSLLFCKIHGECEVDISVPDDCGYAIDSKSLLRQGARIIAVLWSSVMCLSILQPDNIETLCSLVCCVFCIALY